MKRRKRKWPYWVFLPLCLFAFAYIFLPKFLGQKTKIPIQEEYHPVTWSRFAEYQRLQMLLQGFAIESMIDIPCVDTDSLGKAPLQEVRYTGIIFSKDRARALQAQYGSKLRSFVSMEITIDVLPKADLILCWDQLCTMTPQEARSAIVQFKKSGAHFLLMRHFPEIKKNQDNHTGGFQPVNWTLPPYHFPDPIIHIMEKGEYGMESLALWNLENL